MWQKMAWLAILGAFGTLARYGLSGLLQRLHPLAFPAGTLLVNLIGCFLFGWVWSLAEERALISSETAFMLFIGFLGAFTTFSTFAFESFQMFEAKNWGPLFITVIAQNLLGILSIFLGKSFARFF